MTLATLNLEPLITPALWVTLASLSVVLLVWYARRRPLAVTRRRWAGILGLMTIGLAAVFIILLNPVWLQPVPPPAGKPVLTLLIDTSASMATADVDAGRTRFEAAREWAKGIAKQLDQRYDVRTRTFSGAASRVELEQLAAVTPDGLVSDLAAAVAGCLDEDHPQGHAVLLFSDGIHNVYGGVTPLLEAVRTAKAMAVPIHTKTVGGQVDVQDLELTLPRPQELAFVGQNVQITAHLRQRGGLAGSVNVALVHEGERIERQPAELQSDGTTTVQFQVNKDVGGVYRYELQSDALPSEATIGNNSASFVLRVVEEPIRILLLEGKPYWDGKFLMRTLASDPALELDSIVRLRENRFLKRSLRLARANGSAAGDAPAAGDDREALDSAATPAGDEPVCRVESTAILTDASAVFEESDGLDTYQVLVLGRDSDVYLTDSMLDRLRRWISREGGSLVCYRGAPVNSVSQKLARMLPVRWEQSREQRFRVQLTDRGESLNWLSSGAALGDTEVLPKLPSLAAAARPEQPKPLTVVLARSEGDAGPPVVIYQSYGTGRVVTVEGAGMWRWAFLPPQYREHDAVYESLWQSLLRWLVSSVGLVPGENIVLRMDRVSYTTGETVAAMLLLREEVPDDELPAVRLDGADGNRLQEFRPVPLGDEPGVYQAVFGPLPEGRYRATVVAGTNPDNGDGNIHGNDNNSADRPSQKVAFDVRPNLSEQLDVAARADIMARISEESGGATLDEVDASAIAREFEDHIARTRPERVHRITAWDRWWVLTSILCVWATAWGIRRAGGLI